MNQYTLIASLLFIILGWQNGYTQQSKLEAPQDFVQSLDKKLQLSEDQKSKILKVKQKENTKVKKHLAKIEKTRKVSKDKVTQILNLQQRVNWDNIQEAEKNVQPTERNKIQRTPNRNLSNESATPYRPSRPSPKTQPSKKGSKPANP